MFIFIVAVSVVAQSLIALFVLQKNHTSRTNILFFCLSVFLVVWAVINFFITNDPHSSSQLDLYRLLMASVVAQNTFFFLFAHSYPDKRIDIRRHYLRAYLLLSLLTFVVALSPLLFTKVNYGDAGARPVGGPGMLVFILHAAISVLSGLKAIHHRYRGAKGMARQQLRLIFFGSIILWGIVPLTNFVISMAIETLFFARISPIYTLAFSSVIAYAIVTKRLFDIRSAVTRSVGYVLVLVAIAFIYWAIFFGVINVIFPGEDNQLKRQILSTILVMPLVLAFQGLKGFFDKVTRTLFYRGSYDAQEVLDKLGSVVAAEIDLHHILHRTRAILSETLRSSFVEFALLTDGGRNLRRYGNDRYIYNIDDIIGAIKNQRGDLVVTEELPAGSLLKKWLTDNGVGLCLRLKTRKEVVGYLLLGDKKSGDIYNSQDKRLLLIIANELSIAIQNALRFEEIQKFNLTLQAKVDEATRKLRRANEKLRQMDETKDDFISMASHQLRTPLTSVKGYISMVLEGDGGKINPKQRAMLGQAFFSSQRMVYLIADLLNVSRLKTGKFIIEPAPVNLAKVVKEELEQLEETAAVHSLKLTYDHPKSFPDLMLDETKIRQVIMNFVDNAIYYTPGGGQVAVHLLDRGGTVELRVADDGIGVPRSEQPHLFTKFYRAGNARKARPDGTGLGLYMAKKVIAAQGGSLIFESKEGKGSTFGFIFSKNRLKIPAKT